jgi:hypothetical protein
VEKPGTGKRLPLAVELSDDLQHSSSPSAPRPQQPGDRMAEAQPGEAIVDQPAPPQVHEQPVAGSAVREGAVDPVGGGHRGDSGPSSPPGPPAVRVTRGREGRRQVGGLQPRLPPLPRHPQRSHPTPCQHPRPRLLHQLLSHPLRTLEQTTLHGHQPRTARPIAQEVRIAAERGSTQEQPGQIGR